MCATSEPNSYGHGRDVGDPEAGLSEQPKCWHYRRPTHVGHCARVRHTGPCGDMEIMAHVHTKSLSYADIANAQRSTLMNRLIIGHIFVIKVDKLVC